MIGVSRPMRRTWGTRHGIVNFSDGTAADRPISGGTAAITRPLPVAIAGQMPYAGMDPSDQLTWVRPWNPQPGMIAYLNFNGASLQSRTPTGGVQRGRQQRRRG